VKAPLSFLIFALVVAGAAQQSSHPLVQTEMRNVMYHFSTAIAVHIAYLDGELASTSSGGIPTFDDPNSFTILIRSAKISVSIESLSSALNQYVLAARDAPIKAIQITSQSSKLKIKGRLHSKGDVAFETEGELSVTPDGRIRVHTEKIKAGHLPVKGLMDLLGEDLSELIDTRKIAGLTIDKNDLLLTPSELFPPPHIHGKLTSISIAGDEIIQQYGDAVPPALIAGNYMAYHGARLRFGKLTMNDADLLLIDMNPQDPFDFYLDHYKQQMAAGYTKITLNFGLHSYFRDYNKLPHQREGGVRR